VRANVNPGIEGAGSTPIVLGSPLANVVAAQLP